MMRNQQISHKSVEANRKPDVRFLIGRTKILCGDTRSHFEYLMSSVYTFFMTLVIVFCLAALVTFGITRLPVSEIETPENRELCHVVWRVEGLIAFMATLLATSVALIFSYVRKDGDVFPLRNAGAAFLFLAGALYVLLLLRAWKSFPTWVGDVILVVMAVASVACIMPPSLFTMTLPFSERFVNLGVWGMPLAVLWIWLLSRATAALNRTPQVTGGYLGLVALSLLLLYRLGPEGARPPFFFPTAASTALAGIGLMSIFVSLRRPGFNLGWAASCSLGFLLAHITLVGLFKGVALAILAPLLILFGLPVLDVLFVRLRASQHGEKIDWETRRVRLHEALQERGISSTKISFLYLAIATYLCGLALFMVALSEWHFVIRLLILLPLLFGGFIVFFSITRVLMRRAPGEKMPDDIEAFGVRISPVSMSEAIDKIEGFIQEKTPHHVVTSDANAILRAQEDLEYADIIRRAALITPDGYGVMWGARLLNLPIYERVTGVDMVTGICERAAEKGYSIYILGAAPGIAATAAEKLSARFPGLRVAGTQHGFFKAEEETQVIQTIREAKPDVLFVAFGIPKQEKFIAQHFEAMNVPVSLGVGGSFDVYSEKLKRAPEYIQRSGMEWLYRVWQEPWRWKRMSYVPRFMIFALREWIFHSHPKAAAPIIKKTPTL